MTLKNIVRNAALEARDKAFYETFGDRDDLSPDDFCANITVNVKAGLGYSLTVLIAFVVLLSCKIAGVCKFDWVVVFLPLIFIGVTTTVKSIVYGFAIHMLNLDNND